MKRSEELAASDVAPTKLERRRGPRRDAEASRLEIGPDRRSQDRRKKRPGLQALWDAIFGTARMPDTLSVAESIQSGLKPAAWAEFRKFGYTTSELASVLGVSEKTIARKLRSSERMDVVEGDRTMRLADITEHAVAAFGDSEKAKRWLRKPNRVLGGYKPLDLLVTEPGTSLVKKALGAVEYGGIA